MRVYRVVHRKYADDPYSGEGGLHADGRWSRRGRLVSYAADSLALATLETLARARSLRRLRERRLREMMYAPAELQEATVEAYRVEDLPPEWDRRPPGTASRDLGDTWLDEATSVALRVPSVMLPESANYVLNPAHPDFEEALTPAEARPLKLDTRLVERLSQSVA